MKSGNPIRRIKRLPGQPLHEQAEQRLRQLIALPEYRNGALLPEEVGLARHFGISRHTLRLAIGRLVNEGLLVRTAGVGTRVCLQPVRTDVNAWSSFTREMERLGHRVANFEVRFSRALPPPEVAARFGLVPGGSVWHLLRVRGWDGCPAVVAESWLAPDLAFDAGGDFSRPLYEIVQKANGARPVRSSEEISVARAVEPTAGMLRLAPGEPLLLRKRLVFDKAGKLLEFNFNWYRPDTYVLRLDLEADER